MTKDSPTPHASHELLAEIRQLIAESRYRVHASVNMALTLLYWGIGDRIGREVLKSDRAGYGDQLVVSLSRQLEADFGRGYAEKNLRRMVQFAGAFPDREIVATLSRELSWSHFLALLPLSKPIQRAFYAEMSRIEGWSVRVLRDRIDSMLYERKALSRQSEALVGHELAKLRGNGQVGPELILKDPYILDFLDLKDRYLERDFKDAILREMEKFLYSPTRPA